MSRASRRSAPLPLHQSVLTRRPPPSALSLDERMLDSRAFTPQARHRPLRHAAGGGDRARAAPRGPRPRDAENAHVKKRRRRPPAAPSRSGRCLGSTPASCCGRSWRVCPDGESCAALAAAGGGCCRARRAGRVRRCGGVAAARSRVCARATRVLEARVLSMCGCVNGTSYVLHGPGVSCPDRARATK